MLAHITAHADQCYRQAQGLVKRGKEVVLWPEFIER